MSKPPRLSCRFSRTLAKGTNAKRATILLCVAFMFLPISLAGKEEKQKEWKFTPLIPVQVGPHQRIEPNKKHPKEFEVYSGTRVHVIAEGSTKKMIPVDVVVTADAARLVVDKAKERIWFLIFYIPSLPDQKPDLAVPNYVVDTTAIQMIDGQGVELERMSLSDIAAEADNSRIDFYKENYLRDYLVFLGSNLVQPKRESREGTLIFRRSDGVRPVSPFTVRVPVTDPGAGFNLGRLVIFRFVDAP